VRRALATFACLAVLAACGASEEESADMYIGFNALDCFIEGIEAKMQITDVPGFCMLEVNEDRTIGGLCPKIPTGMPRAFRLIYFRVQSVANNPVEVQLATVIETLDLTSETRTLVTLEFSSDDVDTNFDDDNDRLTNIVEVCMGRDPLLMDQ
jgi:hypothetical protein